MFGATCHDKVQPCHSPADTLRWLPITLGIESEYLTVADFSACLSLPLSSGQDSAATPQIPFCCLQGLGLCTSVPLHRCVPMKEVSHPGTFLKFCGGSVFLSWLGEQKCLTAESWAIPDTKVLHVSHVAGLDIPGHEKPFFFLNFFTFFFFAL